MNLLKKKKILEDLRKREYFKVIVGASVYDTELIYKLSFVYTMAGASAIDISPLTSSIKAAKKGINLALKMVSQLGIETYNYEPAIVTSIGQMEDMHFLKASINEDTCQKCGSCAKICPDGCIIIENLHIDESLCRGCGWCVQTCKSKAISLKPSQNEDIPIILEKCIRSGADFVELHLSGVNEEVFRETLSCAKKIVSDDDLLSVVLGSGVMSPVEIVNRAKIITTFHPKSKTIIQADGAPMSNTDIPALDIANFLLYNDELNGMWIQVSGGVNKYTRIKADFLGLKINGTGLGISSLKAVRDEISRSDFFDNPRLIKKAVETANELIKSCRLQNDNINFSSKYINNDYIKWGSSFSKTQ